MLPVLDQLHEKAWQLLKAYAQQARLPQGLLMVGKHAETQPLASTLAAELLCERGQPACGKCHACGLFKAGNHPDFIEVTPAEGKQTIQIDAIRQLSAASQKTALLGGYQVAIISPADAMTLEATNSLLKTLEEPSKQTLLLLLTRKPVILPETLRSRCQQIDCRTLADNFSEDTQGMVQQLLAISSGQADPVAVAGHLKEIGALLPVSYGCLLDLLRLQCMGSGAKIYYESQRAALEKLSQQIDQAVIFRLLDSLQEINHTLQMKIPLNQALLLEDFLIQWASTKNA